MTLDAAGRSRHYESRPGERYQRSTPALTIHPVQTGRRLCEIIHAFPQDALTVGVRLRGVMLRLYHIRKAAAMTTTTTDPQTTDKPEFIDWMLPGAEATITIVKGSRRVPVRVGDSVTSYASSRAGRVTAVTENMCVFTTEDGDEEAVHWNSVSLNHLGPDTGAGSAPIKPGDWVKYDHPAGIDDVKLIEVNPGYAVIELDSTDEANPHAVAGDHVRVTYDKLLIEASLIMDGIEGGENVRHGAQPAQPTAADPVEARLYAIIGEMHAYAAEVRKLIPDEPGVADAIDEAATDLSNHPDNSIIARDYERGRERAERLLATIAY